MGYKMKVCSKCRVEKPLDDFHKNKRSRDGLQFHCKKCLAEYQSDNKDRIRERERNRRLANKSDIQAARRIRYAENADQINEKRRADRIRNPDKYLEREREWRRKNALKIKKQQAERYQANLEDNRKRGREYYQKNKDRLSAYSREYAKINRESVLAGQRRHYWENREKFLELARKYRQENPEKYLAYNRNRRARLAMADGSHTSDDIKRILKYQRCRCAMCEACVKDGYHVDHIVPLSKGGSNWPDNLQILCQSCNQKKYTKCPIQFAQENGKLL